MNARIRGLAPATDVTQALTEAKPIMNDVQQRLAQVVPPPQQQKQYTSMLGTMGKDFADVRQLIAAIQTGDTATEQTLAHEIQALNRKFHSEDADLGLTECNLEVKPQG